MIVKPFGTGKNCIMIVGESPSSVGSAVNGVPFTGKAGMLFFGALRQLGIEKDECYIDNVINWFPFNVKSKNFAGMMKSRITKLREQVIKMKPEKIVCLGKYASDAFSRRIWKQNTKPCLVKVKYKGMKFDLIVTYHPSYVYNYLGRDKMPEKEYVNKLFELMTK